MKRDPSSYRPISVLPIFARVLEKLLATQLKNYCETENIIPADSQFGFRQHSSCEQVLITQTDKWMRELDEGKYVGVILLDFSKAFDTISHQKLMQILCQLNLSNSVIQLFYNYLSDRYQRVMGKEEVSTWESVSRGVPQGSCLSPLLFSLYVKDLSTSNNADTFQFADDTGHSASAENAEILAMELTESFNHTKKFAEENGLILNAAKTQLIVFKQPSKKLSDSFELLLDSEVVKPTDTVKLLGFTLDRHFTFTQHIQSCVQKAHAALGLLRKAVKWMPREISKMAYTALARSQLEYCCMIFAGASITNQQKLEVVQKIAARIICELPRDTHAAPCTPKSSAVSASGTPRQACGRDVSAWPCAWPCAVLKHQKSSACACAWP